MRHIASCDLIKLQPIQPACSGTVFFVALIDGFSKVKMHLEGVEASISKYVDQVSNLFHAKYAPQRLKKTQLPPTFSNLGALLGTLLLD